MYYSTTATKSIIEINSLKRTNQIKWRDTKLQLNFPESCWRFSGSDFVTVLLVLLYVFSSVFSPLFFPLFFILYQLVRRSRYKSFGYDESVIALLFKLLQRSTTFCLANSLTWCRNEQHQMEPAETFAKIESKSPKFNWQLVKMNDGSHKLRWETKKWWIIVT